MKKYDLDFEKRRAYYIKNWQAYNLTDTKQEFIALLNILEAVDENLDSIHNAVINGGYCGKSICDVWSSDREVVESLFYFSAFYTIEDFMQILYENLQEAYNEDAQDGDTYGIDYFIETFIRNENPDCEVKETHDGYVITISC